jgi:hypothetical protein
VADLLTPYYQRSADEIRVPVKSIIFAKADLYPDYKAKILTIRVNKLSTHPGIIKLWWKYAKL